MNFDVKSFCYDKDLTQVKFANIIQESQPTVSLMVRGARSIRSKHLELLRAEYGDSVNSYIISDDVKQIFNSPQSQQVTATIVPAEVVEDIKIETTADSGVVKIEQPPIVPDSIMRRPNIDVLEWAHSAEAEHSQHAFDIREILRKTAFIVKTDDNSMSPTLFQNEYVFLKAMPEGASITDGKCYGIDTTDRGILIRMLYEREDHYLAVAENRAQYSDLIIHKEKTIRTYYIIFHGSTRMSHLANNEAQMVERDKQIAHQNEQISALINQIDKSGERVDRLIDMLEKK